MKNYITRILKKLLKSFGFHLADQTQISELKKLLKKLHPINTDIELVRIGGDSDGGYLLPNDLEGIEALFSPGVGELSLFEEHCAKLGMDVFMADNSVDGPAISNKKFNFIKKFIGANSFGDFITLDDMVNNSHIEDNSDLLLQMDIEGFEYETILNMSKKLLTRCRIIVIEFHYLDSLFIKPTFSIYSSVFNKILQTHECVHIHPNNCSKIIKIGDIEIPPAMEFTFLRKDRISQKTLTKKFPNDLDDDCVKYYPSIALPHCWYGLSK